MHRGRKSGIVLSCRFKHTVMMHRKLTSLILLMLFASGGARLALADCSGPWGGPNVPPSIGCDNELESAHRSRIQQEPNKESLGGSSIDGLPTTENTPDFSSPGHGSGNYCQTGSGIFRGSETLPFGSICIVKGKQGRIIH